MERRLPFVISILLFLVAMGWFSRGLVFPPFYHPDEINKVVQIEANYRNFNHPQLMLNSAAVLYVLGGKPESKLQIAVLTRWVTVFFAAATVTLMAYTAFLLAGPVAQVCCGWLLLTRPLLFELAHYLKEDPALTMGFAAIYLSFLLYVRKTTPGHAAPVGFAAALAISAKYIGIFPALLALAGLAWQSRLQPRHLLYFIVACLLTAAAINWQTIIQLTQFRSGLGREIGLFAERSEEMLNSKNISGVSGEIGNIAWLALAAWLASPAYRKKRLNPAEWLILTATFGYALMVMFSSRSANRYLLPLATSLPLIIAVAACWIGQWLAGWRKQSPILIQAALCLPILLIYGARDMPGLARLHEGFQTDTRKELVEFIRTQVPPQAVLAEDADVKLPDGTPRRSYEGWDLLQQRIRPENEAHLGDEFTVNELRERGVTHTVILLDGQTRAVLEGKKLKLKDKKLAQFLSELDKNGTLLWSSESSAPLYLHPPLRLYALPPTN